MNKFVYIFISLFLVSQIAISQTKNNNSYINSVVEQDDILGKKRNHYCKDHSLSETILRYCYELEKIDFSNCPSDFKEAFLSHRKAWLSLIPITDKYENLRGEMHVLFKQIENSSDGDKFKPLVANIWKTWEDIEQKVKLYQTKTE